MYKVVVAFLCGCTASAEVLYNRIDVLITDDPKNRQCRTHQSIDDERDLEIARGRPHRMRLRHLDKEDISATIECDCGHTSRHDNSWRLRNYGSGDDAYVCRTCVQFFDDEFYNKAHGPKGDQ